MANERVNIEREQQGRRQIVALAVDQVNVLDVMGPLEVFSRANQLLQQKNLPALYELEVISERKTVFTSLGLEITAQRRLAEVSTPHTLFIAGASELTRSAR